MGFQASLPEEVQHEAIQRKMPGFENAFEGRLCN